MILRGWKSIAAYLKVHVKTAQLWHYKRLEMPLIKSAPGKGGKVSTYAHALDNYLPYLFSHGRMKHQTKHSPFKV